MRIELEITEDTMSVVQYLSERDKVSDADVLNYFISLGIDSYSYLGLHAFPLYSNVDINE